MKKHEAIQLLGGTVSDAIKAIGINPQTISQWPSTLPSRLEDRVVATIARKKLPPSAFEPRSAETEHV